MTGVLNGFFLAAIGGALGAGARYLVGVWALKAFGPGFPWATVIVNVAGGLLMGLLIEMMTLRFPLSHDVKLFLTTGILGGFTTFSAFALDFAVLWQRQEILAAFFYVLISVVFSILALFAGLALARFAFQ